MKAFSTKSLLIAFVALIAPLGHATSTSIVDNISTYNEGVYFAESYSISQQFRTDFNSYNLDSVSIMLYNSHVHGPYGGLSVGLFSDQGGSLGNLVAELSPASQQDANYFTLNYNTLQTVQFTSLTPLVLAPNTSYWIGITNPNTYQWVAPWSTALGSGSFGTNSAGLSTPLGTIVTGTAVVPEPSTYALFGIGALGLVIAYRRRVA